MTQRCTLGAWLLRAMLLGVPVLAVVLGGDYFVMVARYIVKDGAAASAPGMITALRWLAVVLGLGAGALLLMRWSRLPRAIESWWWFRIGLGLCLAYLLLVTAVDFYGVLGEYGVLVQSFCHSFASVLASLWAVSLLWRPEALSSPLAGWRRGLELAAMNLVACLLLFEGLLTVYAQYSTSKIFWDYASVQSTLRKFRQMPGSSYFGFPFNADGYYDDDFFVAEKDDFVVALITDSFGVGVTPKELNFSQVVEDSLEQQLGDQHARVAVHNFGIPSINLPEYLYLIEGEVQRFKPSMLVVCLFVGNDLLLPQDPPFGRRSLQQWWVYRLPHRLMLAMKHGTALPKAEQTTVAGGGEWRIHHGHEGNRTVKTREDWFDPAQQKPHFPWDVYVQTEILRARMSQPERPGMQENYRMVRKSLREMAERANAMNVPLAVAVLPDEYQVNDALWQAILQGVPNPDAHQRNYPQEVVIPTLQELGVPVLDLLPVLREAEAGGATFHPQDSHWNARGNQVAGEAIAQWVLTLQAK